VRLKCDHMRMLKQLRSDLIMLANPAKAIVLQRFFKTGKGEYGEGDKFYGIVVPKLRQLAKLYQDLSFAELKQLLASSIHEERLTALLIIIYQYQKSDFPQQKKIFNFYFANCARINNWDLVDLSAPSILGHYLFNQDKKILYTLATKRNLWKRRMAIVATQYFIRNNRFIDTLELAKILLKDQEDLIHKATGWMLREVGKRDFVLLDNFITQYAHHMPRTMLRYAIERCSPQMRQQYLLISHQKQK
jgi:3-methyladenine DNA glycosylase AlkD